MTMKVDFKGSEKVFLEDRTTLLRDLRQRVVAITYRRFWTTNRSDIQGLTIQEDS
jgi:hypothetical protein